jgi:hypothetical protein
MFCVTPDIRELAFIQESFREIGNSFKTEKVSLAGKSLLKDTAVWALLANSLMSLDKFKCKE